MLFPFWQTYQDFARGLGERVGHRWAGVGVGAVSRCLRGGGASRCGRGRDVGTRSGQRRWNLYRGATVAGGVRRWCRTEDEGFPSSGDEGCPSGLPPGLDPKIL